jgi:restriction endonuclease Mrr
MKWLDATEQVLRDFGTPVHYEELAIEILRRHLVETRSQTPAITLHASVSLDVRRRQEKGLPPRFTIGYGDVGLAEWEPGPSDEAREIIERTRGRAQRDLLARLRDLDGADFESFLEVLLSEMGYSVTVIGGTRDDEGIDLVAELAGGAAPQRIGMQAKCLGPRREVGPTVIRLLRDSLDTQGCNAGAVITTARFNADAVRVAEEPGKLPIELIDGSRLVDLAVEYGVGVRIENLTMYHEQLEGVFYVGDEESS